VAWAIRWDAGTAIHEIEDGFVEAVTIAHGDGLEAEVPVMS
jgi:hypothetical protein